MWFTNLATKGRIFFSLFKLLFIFIEFILEIFLLESNTNALYYDDTNGEITYSTTLSSPITTSINMPITDFTSYKQSINYLTTVNIQSSNINAQIDGWSEYEQVYTFGKSIPNRWVAVGSGTNKIAYSSDGITWTGVTGTSASIFTAGYGVAYNNYRENRIVFPTNRMVAVGLGTNKIAYSDDNGETWTAVATSPFTSAGHSVAWNGTRWVADGQ